MVVWGNGMHRPWRTLLTDCFYYTNNANETFASIYKSLVFDHSYVTSYFERLNLGKVGV